MRMIGDLFREVNVTVDDKGASEGHIRCSALLIPQKECSVLKAHFPGRPVVPGACLMATVNELVCRMLQKDCQADNVKNIKFVSLIEPDGDEPVAFNVEVEVATMRVKATIQFKDTVCCKMSLTCRTAS